MCSNCVVKEANDPPHSEQYFTALDVVLMEEESNPSARLDRHWESGHRVAIHSKVVGLDRGPGPANWKEIFHVVRGSVVR